MSSRWCEIDTPFSQVPRLYDVMDSRFFLKPFSAVLQHHTLAFSLSMHDDGGKKMEKLL